jgi:membrane associated rhomboid family serine protease
MSNLTPMVQRLLLLNIVIFAVDTLLHLNLNKILGLYYVFSPGHELYKAPYSMVTYMFLHGSFWHLFSNMLALFMFGPVLEHIWGGKTFLRFYLITGIGAGILYGIWSFVEIYPIQQLADSYIQSPSYGTFLEFVNRFDASFYLSPENYKFIKSYENAPIDSNFISQTNKYVKDMFLPQIIFPMVGASGAIFGLLTAFGMIFPNVEMMIFPVPFPIKAKYFVILYGLYELYQGTVQVPGDNVAHLAHLGGMAVAFVLLKTYMKTSKRVNNK